MSLLSGSETILHKVLTVFRRIPVCPLPSVPLLLLDGPSLTCLLERGDEVVTTHYGGQSVVEEPTKGYSSTTLRGSCSIIGVEFLLWLVEETI